MARIFSTRRISDFGDEAPYSLDLARVASIEPAGVFSTRTNDTKEVTRVTLDAGRWVDVDEKYPDLLAAWKGKEALP